MRVGVPMRTLFAIVAVVACVAVVATPAGAQISAHGSPEILLVNPDLAPRQDGAVHVGGDFIGQIVLRGDGAEDIVELGFSFGAGPPPPQYAPVIVGIRDFRHDDIVEDGWILPITAGDTPPGAYNFAVSAYTRKNDQGSEVARIWGPAVLEAADATAPWPWILPGETASLNNPYAVTGVTIEFAEEATATMWVNGVQVTLEEWTPPARDDDNVPRYTDPTAARVLGSGYKWVGEVNKSDVIRVQATDAAGNAATKAVLAGFGIDNPAIETTTRDVRLAGKHGDTLQYCFDLANRGLAPADAVLVTLDVARLGWGASPQAGPLAITVGGTSNPCISVTLPARGAAGVYDFAALTEYTVGSDVARTQLALRAEITGGTGATGPTPAGNATTEEEAENLLPAPAGFAVLAALAVAAAGRRVRSR